MVTATSRKPTSAMQKLNRISQGGRKKKAGKKRYLWVIKLSRIPFGFFERELLGYFRQFGTVIRVRVARSKKTGNHKGWAFVGFDNKEVAEIAAESMNGYLMFRQQLVVRVLKPEEIPKCMLKGRVIPLRPSFRGNAKKDALARNMVDGKKDEKLRKARFWNLQNNLNKLKNKGIDYDFSVNGKSPKSIKTEENNSDIQIIQTNTPKPQTMPVKTTKTQIIQEKTPKTSNIETKTPKTKNIEIKTPKTHMIQAKTPKTSNIETKTPKTKNIEIKTPKTQIVETKTPKKVKIVESKSPKTPKTPKEARVMAVQKTPAFSPKTRAAKRAAASAANTPAPAKLLTPAPKSTISQAIQKTIAASARATAVPKKIAGGKKKKSL
ncbi:unnamed protein product [Caenorhabditis bovis]|uniref:RRM domain-containing protein n=1 Tax=Caenorhabditis bovis TaxID=2654633 RepID=A0A8S1EU69_9PELO|nr:unnamed protein product [Caenorhabditis bovis]